MPTNIVFTLTGKDRVGLVDEVTQALLERGGNILASRMAHLGGEFAMLMLVTLPEGQLAQLERDASRWHAQGYQFTLTRTQDTRAAAAANTVAYHIRVVGADHEGIIHAVARFLAQHGINIEELTTQTTPAPISGQPLFSMDARVAAPAQLAEQAWQAALAQVEQELNVDLEVNRAE